MDNIKKTITKTSFEKFAYCDKVKELVEHTIEIGKLDQVHLKLGIDGGGGFHKICLSILSNYDYLNEENEKNRR